MEEGGLWVGLLVGPKPLVEIEDPMDFPKEVLEPTEVLEVKEDLDFHVVEKPLVETEMAGLEVIFGPEMEIICQDLSYHPIQPDNLLEPVQDLHLLIENQNSVQGLLMLELSLMSVKIVNLEPCL